MNPHHLRVVKATCSTTVFACLLLWGSHTASAGDKEQRMPRHAAFDSLATLIAYEDQITPPEELLPTTAEIWTVFPDGLAKQRLTSGHRDTNPRFSSDGKQIIFEREAPLTSGLLARFERWDSP